MITISGLICYSALAQGVANDPYASNNGNFPSRSEYTGPLTVANLNYDFITPTSTSAFVSSGAITVQSAPAYLDGLKKYLAPTIGKLINAQAPWDPATNGWYDMIWIGQGKSLSNGSLDLGAGREPISNTYTGQNVGGRQNVIFVGGGNQFVNQLSQGASSCLNCDSAAEYPWTQNLYPSPNRAFPHDGAPFVLFNPGSPQWERWFQNRPGRYGVSEKVFPRGLDYDYAIMFALQAQASAVGNEGYSFDDFKAH